MKFWNTYLTVFYSIIILVFFIDYQWYAYRNTRLDGEFLGYIKDAGISMQMAWQSYPVLRILLLLAVVIYVIHQIVKAINSFSLRLQPIKYQPLKSILATLFFFVLAFGIYGKWSTFPLRWSDAFSLNNDFKANMALNPFQSFVSSLKFTEEKVDLEKVKKYYPVLAKTLQFPLTDSVLNYNRSLASNTSTKPNIVLVLCESFSMYKSSLVNNELDPTPFVKALSKESLFFSNCFTPAYGTARGVWATLTGIPDVTLTKTATRNPKAVKQHTIIEDFDGYEKYYFLGGDATWANIRGLIKNNIKDVKLYEQDDYNSPKVDVWGISDRNLFKEATNVINQTKNPFFAVIQTANNHRPFTIPSNDFKEMGIQTKSISDLLENGFNVEKNSKKTNEEFNAMRYMDFCIKDFITNAKKQPWFKNTIFLFIGDHGIRGNGGNMIPKVFTDKGLTCQHVPLLIYSSLIKGSQIDFPCSQVDVLPTLAGLAGIQYRNTTLGRDLTRIMKDTAAPKFAFIIDHDIKEYGIIANNNFYSKQIKGKKESLIPINPSLPSNTPISYYQNLATSIFETSRYWMYNNK